MDTFYNEGPVYVLLFVSRFRREALSFLVADYVSSCSHVCGPHELFADNTGKTEPVSYSVS